ncbi:MAG: hypothetical protein ACKOEC_11750 [Acidimicrobiia bacterium]
MIWSLAHYINSRPFRDQRGAAPPALDTSPRVPCAGAGGGNRRTETTTVAD